MNNLNIYNQEVLIPYFGVIIAIIVVLPSILIKFIFKPNNKIEKRDRKRSKFEKLFEIIEKISMCFIIVLLCLDKSSFNIINANIYFGIMLFFFILYYELFIRYIIGGCEYKLLYSPFVYIKVPMPLFKCLGLIFASIWENNILLLIICLIFSVSHIYCKYKMYITK